jgi:hypothetical protein
MLTDFYYDRTYRVIIYKLYKIYIILSRSNQERYLRAQSYHLLGAELKTAIKYLNSLDLKTTEQLGLDKLIGIVVSIPHLKIYNNFRYLLGDVFLIIYLPRI